MRKSTLNLLAGIICLFFIFSCGSGSDANQSSADGESISSVNNGDIDICKCLSEPGNSAWSIQNKEACRDAISKELGVENWEKVNFSKEPELNRKWDELAEKCTGSAKVETGIDAIDRNNEIVSKMGTSYGYIWESLNTEAQVYTTLAFDGLVFRLASYTMNGETNSENFTKMIEISGKWKAIDATHAEGVIAQNNVPVSWEFSDDYSTLVNNKGVRFKRVRVK